MSADISEALQRTYESVDRLFDVITDNGTMVGRYILLTEDLQSTVTVLASEDSLTVVSASDSETSTLHMTHYRHRGDDDLEPTA